MEQDKDKLKALDLALAGIEKAHGKGAVMKMGEKGTMAIEAVPTGALGLDLALGIGGLPRGRVTEIYGPESSGKSTLAMHVVAEAQRMGGICAYVDAEHAMDPVYARAIGVDVDELLISQPDTGEQALEITDMLIRSGAIDVVVIDSVAALTPRAEIEGDMGDSHMGLQARLMSPGAAQAHRQPQQDQHHLHLHQPAAREDRRDVRLHVLWHARDAGRWHAGEDRQDRQPEAPRRGAELRRRSRPSGAEEGRRLVRQRPHRPVPHVRRRQARWERSGPVRLHAEPPGDDSRGLARSAGAPGGRPGDAVGHAPALELPVGGHPRWADG